MRRRGYIATLAYDLVFVAGGIALGITWALTQPEPVRECPSAIPISANPFAQENP